jgi:hypothetical protein
MADYLDPEMRQYKLVLLTTANGCSSCADQFGPVAALQSTFVTAKIGALGVLVGPSTDSELTSLLTQTQATFSLALDRSIEQASAFASSWGVTHIFVDARSMEILEVHPGQFASTADFQTELQKWSNWIDANPTSLPAYTCTAGGYKP